MKHVIIDGSAVASMEDIHAILARELEFPAWYGSNLDALHDCLTGLSEDTGIYVLHAQALMTALGPAYTRFCRVLADSAEENPYLQIQL